MAHSPSPNLTSALAAAARHHHEGRLREAEAIYKDILREAPDHAEALHLLGLVAYQSGRPEQAIELTRSKFTWHYRYVELGGIRVGGMTLLQVLPCILPLLLKLPPFII